jgi:tripartite-type tricarboxylate transporter receptor subunit TctC
MIKRVMLLSVLVVSLVVLPAVALAQSYPSKPITLVVPFGAGAPSDAVARFLSDRAAKLLGTTMLIEYKAGANGAIASREVAKAAPDGYTLILNSNSGGAANVHLYKVLHYDPVKDFAPITSLTRNPLMLTIRSGIPAKTIDEFVQYAKANPGKLNYGVGNSSSIANSSLFMTMTGFTAVQASYKALPAALIDLLGGRLDFLFIDPFLVKDHIASGALRPLGVTSTTRLKAMPNVPAIAEAVKGYELVGWIAAFAPAKTPAPIIAKLNKAFVDALKMPESDTYLESLGMQAFPSSPEALGKYQVEQIDKWGDVLRKAGVEKE